MPKPPPLQSIFESTNSSVTSIQQQQQPGVGVASASQGSVVSYGVQPTAAAVGIGGVPGDQRQQIMANVSSVNVMIPAATPTIQATQQQQQQQDASNMLQTIGGKKKVRQRTSIYTCLHGTYVHMHIQCNIRACHYILMQCTCTCK